MTSAKARRRSSGETQPTRSAGKSARRSASGSVGRSNRPSTVVLRLDASIYSAEAVERTRRAFSHLAAIEARRQGPRWTVRFSNLAAGLGERLADEFANHALSCLMVDR